MLTDGKYVVLPVGKKIDFEKAEWAKGFVNGNIQGFIVCEDRVYLENNQRCVFSNETEKEMGLFLTNFAIQSIEKRKNTEVLLDKTIGKIRVFLYLDLDLVHNEFTFRDIINLMLDTYETKNADYGNAFEDGMDKLGLAYAQSMFHNKTKRFANLIDSDVVNHESLFDTVLDLANYAVMTAVWLKNNEKED